MCTLYTTKFICDSCSFQPVEIFRKDLCENPFVKKSLILILGYYHDREQIRSWSSGEKVYLRMWEREKYIYIFFAYIFVILVL